MEDENEVGLPAKGISMIIKEVLPDMRIANESRELFAACCVEFVKHVARGAQHVSGHDQRKTIYHEHVLKALQLLQFPPDYCEAADSVLGECKVSIRDILYWFGGSFGSCKLGYRMRSECEAGYVCNCFSAANLCQGYPAKCQPE
ncbi:hypothetical protein OESDEN_12364 [Oesophagostomum dentatum]|uniref:Protein Dr1 n=1 Tax=Oesophagostomum dentatum TaxID=61180 RepID=A0A0B1SRB0_OESDE|nr:hypothetical protein OESDEN_12364 [Oesophagostomum dentatum]